MGKWGWRRLTQLDTVQPSHVHNSAYATQQFGTVEPYSVISSMLAWIHRYVTFSNALFSMMRRIPQNCKQNFGGDLSTIATLMFIVLHVMLNSSALLNPDHKSPSPLTWIHRCATLCNAPFLKRQSIPELVHYNFGGELSIIATLMFAMLHVLLNSSSHEYIKHPWKVYVSILGVSCPPLLGWCS